jgi:hypothetical protein
MQDRPFRMAHLRVAVAPETELAGSQASGGLGVDYSIDGSGVVAQILSDGFYRKPKKIVSAAR